MQMLRTISQGVIVIAVAFTAHADHVSTSSSSCASTPPSNLTSSLFQPNPCQQLSDKSTILRGKSHPSTGPLPPLPPTLMQFSTNCNNPSNRNNPSHSNTNNIDKIQDSNDINNIEPLQDINMSQLFTKRHRRLLAETTNSIPPYPANSPLSNLFPEPIVYQYTLYYPGNIPLVITAGHGGSSVPGKRTGLKMTHRFMPVSDLATTSAAIDVSSFSELVASNNIKDDTEDGEEMIPWMPPRDQSKGGNFKKDLNTHSMALNLANAISCLTSREASKGRGAKDGGTQKENSRYHNDVINDDDADSPETQDSIPERCKAQGPWGDNDWDYPFPSQPPSNTALLRSPSVTPSVIPRPQSPSDPSPSHASDSTRMRYPTNPVQSYPHVVVFRVPRLYVDVNRNISGENAIADHPASEAAWREYHDLIDHVQKIVEQRQHRQPQESESRHAVPDKDTVLESNVQGQGANANQQSSWFLPNTLALSSATRGLLLDIHGHVHATNLIEIGYLLNGSVLALDDQQLDACVSAVAKESSIHSLISRVVKFDLNNNPEQSTSNERQSNDRVLFSTLIRGGEESLGGMLQRQGLNAVPSPGHQAPYQECIYFFGGYTTQSHGSHGQKRDGSFSSFDAIQLELPKTLRLVGKEEGREIGMNIGKVVVEFMSQYYGVFEDPTRSMGVAVATNEKEGSKTVLLAPTPKLNSAPLLEQKRSGSGLGQTFGSEVISNQRGSLWDGQQHERHSGDSDIEDGTTNESKKSTHQCPEMRRQSSRL
ncbi:hypothetical protein BGX27_004519 [Mortierella sp. AM989]|nr:hypothetical protein BGX27_004519 [Mortierella sp. AM989]